MPGTHKVEHVKLQVDNLGEAEQFYRDVFGLAEITTENDTIYLGCGLDTNYDLAIQEGDPGVEHVAVRVSDPAQLDTYEERLGDAGVETVRTDGDEPGQERGLRFRLPSELAVELVTVADTEYSHSEVAAVEGRGGAAPLDLNHYTFLSPDVKRDAEFLADHLDFKVSEVVGPGWSGGAFLRRGDKHHDIAIFSPVMEDTDHALHHHTAFTLSSVDHMVQVIDRICQAGLHLEFGIGRHHAGDNLYSYFQAPDGHRIELNPSMAELDDSTPTARTDDVLTATLGWKTNANIPDSFLYGSGLAR